MPISSQISITLDDDKLAPSADDDKVISEAKKNFTRCERWESRFRRLMVEDVQFANGDSDNMYQWPNNIRRQREYDQKPCMTVNITQQHNFQIINDAKQNKPSVKIRAVGGGASYQSAQIYEGIIRHIEYISNAQDAYDLATKWQVEGGIGYWRLAIDYPGDDTFDQEIFIRPIPDPLSVFLDPDIQQPDGSDASFGFIFDDLTRTDFRTAYPQFAHLLPGRAALGNGDGWIDRDHVRIAEYFRRVPTKDKFVEFMHPQTGARHTFKLSEAPDDMVEIFHLVMDDPQSKVRDVAGQRIERYIIVGDEIAEKNVGKDAWPGIYIPIIRLVGIETKIAGQLDRKGHTRALKDPQRTYNYDSSASLEFGALQTKVPFKAPARAIEGLETYWESANRTNHSILPYNDIDDDGNPIASPERIQPPVSAPAFLQGMEIAKQDMSFVSGQYQPKMGEPSNERSGKALMARMRQGDTATFHFQNNLGIAIRYTGKQLIDLIPKVYDAPRILKIMAQDGVEYDVSIDPNARVAYMQNAAKQGEAVRAIFNPNIGKYDVMADMGPSFGTRRREAFTALLELATINPDIMKIAGDLFMKMGDWPGSDILAERFKRAIDPAILGNAPPPQMVALQQQVQKMQGIVATLTQQLAEKELEAKGKSQQKTIDAYNAETQRIKVLGGAIDPANIAQMAAQAVLQVLMTNLPTQDDNAASPTTALSGSTGGIDNGAAPNGSNGRQPGASVPLGGFSEQMKQQVEGLNS